MSKPRFPPNFPVMRLNPPINFPVYSGQEEVPIPSTTEELCGFIPDTPDEEWSF